MKTVTVTKARASLHSLVDEVSEDHVSIKITGRRRDAVLVSKEAWTSIEGTLFMLSVPGMRESIKAGLKTPVKKCSEKPGR
jgi:prevent-host-death family protein